MKLLERPTYLEFLFRHKDKAIIKVVKGVRRSGKSTLFELYRRALLAEGVPQDHLITINFEDLTFYELRDFRKLNAYLENLLLDDEKYYIFLDEIQHVPDFELVANSLFIKPNVDLYLTGSNAYFMSGDLATNLTGRYVELEVLPLSFAEYVQWGEENGGKSTETLYRDYSFSAFPYLLQSDSQQEKIDYLTGVYHSILVNDVLQRAGNADADLIQRILRVLLSSIGSLVSVNKIVNTLKSQQVKISNLTLEKYLTALTDSLVLYQVPRYDIKGRSLLQRMDKFYTVDMGFRHLLLPDHQEDEGHLLENLVYLELRRRYPHVYVGNMGKYEVDFVAITAEQHIHYYQVALSTLESATLARELRSLQAIHDQYSKTLLTLDPLERAANYEGIEKKNVLDWFLEGE